MMRLGMFAVALVAIMAGCASGEGPTAEDRDGSAAGGGGGQTSPPAETDFPGPAPQGFGSGAYAGDVPSAPSSSARDAGADAARPMDPPDMGQGGMGGRPDAGFQLCRPLLACTSEGATCKSVCVGAARNSYECRCESGRYRCTQMMCPQGGNP